MCDVATTGLWSGVAGAAGTGIGEAGSALASKFDDVLREMHDSTTLYFGNALSQLMDSSVPIRAGSYIAGNVAANSPNPLGEQ